MESFGYKLVAKDMNGFSSLMGFQLKDHCLTYIPNQPTLPKIGGIFFFPNYEDARRFLNEFHADNIEFWKCSVLNPRPIEFVSILCHNWTVETFWKKNLGKTYSPKGSHVCDSLTLLEKMECTTIS